MIIDRDLRRYVIHAGRSIQEAATQIASWHGQIAFCIDENGRLLGSVSNGDLIRWLAAGGSNSLEANVSEIANRSVTAGMVGDAGGQLAGLLEKFLYVPLVDQDHRIVAVARRRSAREGLTIGRRTIGPDHPVFVIAEIGNNHNGDLDTAYRLIDAAADAGADCAKFQMRDMGALYGQRGQMRSEDLGTEYLFDLLSRFQLSDDDLLRCFDYTSRRGMVPLCTAWEERSAQKCRNYGLEAMKVASADLTNHELLRFIARLELPLICSTGMSTEAEIVESSRILQSEGAHYVMLHCNSTYPAPFRDVNLRYLARLANLSGGSVGYSGHERDVHVACSAVALGACVIEKHISLDRDMEGNDHKVSLLPAEFQRMVEGIRQTEEALGTDEPRDLSQGERTNRVALSKSIFAAVDIDEGSVIEPSMLTVHGPGQGLQPNRLPQLIGMVARRRITAHTPFYESDLSTDLFRGAEESYDFGLPWGIPVRHRDAVALIAKFRPELVEFHLSYRDLKLRDEEFFEQKYGCGLVVHAPELFEGDHTLDLTSPSPEYRAKSIAEMKRVMEKTRSLARFFNATGRVGIIVNVGGFSAERFLTPGEREVRKRHLVDSWAQLRDDNLELWPQTMPPYPWHFGGQKFHNLFVTEDDVVELCSRLKTRICLDVSHSRLACNELGRSFDSFLAAAIPLTAHLHLADAKGSAGEGLQIGDGEIDFEKIFRLLHASRSQASFIPEIWQGHENEAEGARLALTRLWQAACASRS